MQAKATAAGNPNLIIAATKSFADGSTQGYTGFLSQPHFMYFFPFTDPTIFAQPHTGLADLSQAEIQARAVASHQAGFPIVIHQNGDQAITGALASLQAAQSVLPSPNLRDVVLHDQMATLADLVTTSSLNDPASFLMGELYYWDLPMRQQILELRRATTLYPADDAIAFDLHVTPHTDTPVIPAYPLFTIWIAKTRSIQQMPWYSATNPARAGASLGPNEAIAIAQGVQAFTSQAAWHDCARL